MAYLSEAAIEQVVLDHLGGLGYALATDAEIGPDGKAPEREAILCQLVARDAGKLSAFSAGGQAFDADALAKCNAHAK